MPRIPRDEIRISVDVETSGPSPTTGSLLSVGACLVDDPERAFYRELLAPGKATTRKPAWCARRANREPGSEIPGVPASLR